MRLLRVEVDRFTSRRLARFAVLGALAIVAIAILGMWQTAKPLPESQVAMMRADFEIAVQEWEENGDEIIATCEADEAVAQKDDPSIDFGCEMQEPVWENWTWEEPTFAEESPNILPVLAVPLAFVSFLVGVSFLAAEFTTGSMGNWLTFEPRRTRVYFSKVAAAAVATVPVALVVLAVAIGGAWVAYTANDHVGTMTTDRWGEVAVSGVRVLLLMVGFAALGAALGALVRHTAAVMGIVLGYAVVVEGMLGSLVEALQPYLLRLNMMAVASGEATYGTEECRMVDGAQVCEWVQQSVSLTHGAVTMGAVLVVGVVLGWVTFRRRDVV
ncbi:ABC transporter permease subunit [Sanguibacter sp. 25GB23B1]|uniref:ABC transporter permease subunit n=1 Tax=unclassified Sanguibacter TaxID=2645534 RepID=UPI0032AEFD84